MDKSVRNRVERTLRVLDHRTVLTSNWFYWFQNSQEILQTVIPETVTVVRVKSSDPAVCSERLTFKLKQKAGLRARTSSPPQRRRPSDETPLIALSADAFSGTCAASRHSRSERPDTNYQPRLPDKAPIPAHFPCQTERRQKEAGVGARQRQESSSSARSV